MRKHERGTGKVRGVTFAECCGQVCDERCRDASVRFRGFERRLATPGSVRVS